MSSSTVLPGLIRHFPSTPLSSKASSLPPPIPFLPASRTTTTTTSSRRLFHPRPTTTTPRRRPHPAEHPRPRAAAAAALSTTTPSSLALPSMNAIRTTIAENLGGPAHALAPSDSQFSLDAVPDLTGKVAVVTGGSEGIGYGCTHTLLSHNVAKLFIISQSADIVSHALAAIRAELGAAAAARVEWLPCDLSDWDAAADTATQIARRTPRLDILICNAARGIMTAQRAPTNGVDLHMAVNHVGHSVVTSHLLPLLKRTAAEGRFVRVVHLGSNLHELAPADTRFESVEELNRDLGPNAQYARSKLAAILYARYLAAHLRAEHPNVLVNASFPGIVDTRQTNEHIHEAYPLGGYGMSVLAAPFKKSAMQGAVSTMYAATATERSGEYVCPPAIVEKGSEMSGDRELGERLMRLTRELVAEKTREASVEQGCPFKDY
ncbi:retinol dehydrogenase 12 [Diplodia corticola]|uniref:Retinol dehydrogenase 12 n=1 Tax=Diplodia corticola TaxID=236234 RepID=A0A1J9RUE6_9PEZI|nr:retinol dehydrogenase 12 [Diplodia corticola]OJD31476.1 retinol dehydrogenase 12 [Diplodia corticola]